MPLVELILISVTNHSPYLRALYAMQLLRADGANERRVACIQEAEVAPVIASHWENATFPHDLIPKLAKLNLGKGPPEKGHHICQMPNF